MGRTTFSGPIRSLAGFVDEEGEYIDIDFSILIRSTGPGVPTLETLSGNVTAPQWQVDDFNVCEGQELVHGYKEGTPLNWHLHLITNGVNVTDRYVKFSIEWYWANVREALSAAITTTSADILIPADTPDRTMVIGVLGSVELPDARIGAHVWARLTRVDADGTAPTGNPFCTMLQAHIRVDTLGSRNLGTK